MGYIKCPRCDLNYILEEDLGVFNGGNGSVKIAFSIPKDTVNYLIKFGTYGHIIAYYKV